MGASNFHKVNASKYFANKCEEEYEYEDLVYNIHSELAHSPYYFKKDYGKDHKELRSYPSRVLGTISASKIYKDFEVKVSIVAIVRSGYYEGCNLDWSISYDVSNQETDEIDFTDIIEMEAYYTARNARRYAAFAEKWAKTKSEEMINFIEKIYTRYSDQYQATATFSNGETIYEKVA